MQARVSRLGSRILKPSDHAAGAGVLASRPELSARLAAARVQGLGKQLAEAREALRQKSAELSAVAREAAQLRKERAQLQQRSANIEAQVLGLWVHCGASEGICICTCSLPSCAISSDGAHDQKHSNQNDCFSNIGIIMGAQHFRSASDSTCGHLHRHAL